MIPAAVLLGAVTAERLAELWLARRNTTDLLVKGAREFAPSHYPAIVLLHAFWLAGLWFFGWMHPLSSFWLMIFLVLQALRVWILMTLGDPLDHAHHRSPGRPPRDDRPLSFSITPKLFRRDRGDRSLASLPRPALVCSDLLCLECNRSNSPRPGRECGVDWIALSILIELCITHISAVRAETWPVFDLTHGPDKSDPGIVAMKPPNKTEQSVADANRLRPISALIIRSPVRSSSYRATPPMQ
jgi:hypothetical protein